MKISSASKASFLSNEKARLKVLQRYHILDTPPEGFFDRITAMAARLFGMPMAFISLVDQDRVWFKSKYGCQLEGMDRLSGLCSSAILTNKVYQVPNTVKDARLKNSPLVTGEFGLRSYVAAPLHTHDGFNIGTLCLMGRETYSLNGKTEMALRDLAAIAMDQIELRLAVRNYASIDTNERSRLYEKLIQMQKDESLSILVGGISHDCNNLLLSVLGSAELLRQRAGRRKSSKELTDNIATAAQRLSDLFQELRSYAASGKGQVEVLDPRGLIFEAIKLSRHLSHEGVKVKTKLSKLIWNVHGDPVQIEQVLLNICVNAYEAMGSKGSLTISSENIQRAQSWLCSPDYELPAGDYVHIIFSDNGCGMDEETRRHLFDLSFSTKGSGRGLGLAAAMGIIRNHGGSIHVESKVGKGSTFHIYLPRTGKPLIKLPPVELSAQRSEGGTVLLIEDEKLVRHTVKMMLESNGYQVIEAEDGEQGIELCKKQKDEIRVVLLDSQLPKMNGIEVFSTIRKINPKIKIVLSSGNSREVVFKNIREQSEIQFLQKPYKLSQLAEFFRTMIAS
jgi:signal transduction histidine kinase/CheY-like chemotaxis protein